jgi:hypothetical protein
VRGPAKVERPQQRDHERTIDMITKYKTSFAALLLLAIAAFVPACDILSKPKPCNPNIEVCEFTGNHPGTLGD